MNDESIVRISVPPALNVTGAAAAVSKQKSKGLGRVLGSLLG